MRWLLVLLVAGACETRNGAYIVVDGDSTGIGFDHVELFFGTKSFTGTLVTPIAPVTGPIYQRDYDPESDQFEVPPKKGGRLQTETTFWVPFGEETATLQYVAAVVSKQGKPVGIGEIEKGFFVDSSRPWRFEIELEPYILAEQWGETPGCLAWTRARRDGFNTIVVGRNGDQDCDERRIDSDCDDLCSTLNAACVNTTVCGDTSACSLGCNMNGTCAATTCLTPLACVGECALRGTLDLRLQCMIDKQSAHIEINVDRTSSTNPIPCTDQVLFRPYTHACVDPVIEWVDPRQTDDFTFAISAEANGDCTLAFQSPTNATLVGQHHLLVSLAAPSFGAQRPSVIVGVNPSGLDCRAPDPFAVTLAAGTIWTCTGP